MERLIGAGRHMWAQKLWLVLGILLAFAVGYLIRYSFYGGVIPEANGATSDTKGRLIIMKDRLQFASLETQQTSVGVSLTTEVKETAKKRKNELVEMIRADPAEARKLLLSPQDAKILRDKGVAEIEEYTTLTGRYGFLQYEDENGDHFDRQIITPEGNAYTINTEQMLPKITHGSTVKVSGFIIEDQLLVDAAPGAEVSYAYNAQDNVTTATSSDPAPITTITSASAVTTTGQQNILVLMGNFTGSALKVDPVKIKSYYNSLPGQDLAGYVAEVSSNTASLNPTFFGTYDYSNIACSDQKAQTNALKDSVAGQVDLNAYSVVSYVTNCNVGSFASWGGSGSRTNYIGLSTNPSFDLFSIVHEYVHTLGSGLSHGGYLGCGAEVFIPPTTNVFDENSCQVAEYDDPFDVLGEYMQGYTGHLSVSHKLEAGWLDSSRVPTLSTVGTHVYTLAPLEQSTGTVGLKIPRGGGKAGYFTVEYRQPIGRDSYIASANSCFKCSGHTGATVRLAGMSFAGPGGGADSNILDSTPGSLANTSSYWPNTDGRDGALVPGKSLTDSEYGITISTLSADASGVKVEVKIPNASCVNNTPQVSAVTPAIQTAIPGQLKTYSMTVTNMDTASCAPQTYRFVPSSLALAYASQLAQDTISILASPDYFKLVPGESKQLVFTVTSTQDTPDGTYLNPTPQLGFIYAKSFGVQAAIIPAFTYRVASPVDTVVPSFTSGVVATPLGSSAVKLEWSPGQDNARVISYEIKLSNGAVYYTTKTSFVVHALTASTQYTASVRAMDGKMNYSAPSDIQFTMKAATDTTPPKKPGQMIVSTTDHSSSLLWTPVSDNQILACYLVTVTGYSQRCMETGAQTSYGYAGLPSRYRQSHTIAAFDGDGNVALGKPSIYYTAVEGDTSAPTAPDKIYIASQTYAGGTQVRWQGSNDNKNVVGYNVFRGCCKSVFTTTNSYTFPDTSTVSARLQAVDSDGSLSAESADIWLASGPATATSDVAAPLAAVKTPFTNSAIAGSVTLEANASDNTVVTSVGYYIDGAYVGESSMSPNFPLQLDTTNYLDGKHWIVALARDAAGNRGSSGPSDIFFVNSGDGVPPSISITAPSNGATVNGSITINTAASDVVGVSQVDFQVGGRIIATDKEAPFTAIWDSTKITNGPHTITAIASDRAGNSAASSIVLSVIGNDIVGPTAPTTLRVTATDATHTNAVWNPATDDVGVVGYYLVRNGVTIASPSTTTYSDAGLEPTNAYEYYVIAYDAAGNISVPSNSVTVTMPNALDTIAPSTPTGLASTTVSASQINLNWSPSTDNVAVSGYDVYRDNQKITTVSSTSFGDTNLTAGRSYSYYVIAKDTAGNSSVKSNTITASTQSSPPDSKATLQGIITTQTGSPISGAAIAITINRTTYNYTSGLDGSYRINNLSPGTYTTKYSAKGFKTYAYKTGFVAGQIVTKNVTLISNGR